MEKKERSRKEWIKNILIVFLVIMLLLTFFSNTIMNRSLPEVSTAYIMNGSINTSIKGNGVIASVDPYIVSISEGRRIDSVLVRRGMEVQKGDVLFTLEEGDSTEVINAKRAYDNLVDEYRTRILDEGISQDIVDAAERRDMDVIDDKMNRLQARASVLKEKKDALKVINDKVDKYKDTEVDASAEEGHLEIVEKAMEVQDEIDSVVNNYNYLSPEEQAAKKDETINKIVELSTKRDGILAPLKSYGYDISDVKKLQTEINKKITEKNKNYADGLKTLEDEQKTAKRAYDEAYNNYESLKDEIKVQKELQDQLDAIDDAQAYYERLCRKSSGNEVLAPVSGTITSVDVVAGEKIMAEQQLAVIQLSGKDYILEMPVTKEQASRIRVGDQGKSDSGWYYYDLNLYVSAIKPDLSNPKSGNKIVVFTVTGSDIMVGQNMTVSVGERSANYDKIVPNTAIREDKNGTYILVVVAKSTPLGNRYTATRVDVTKIASDDVNTAISCGLEGYESVITTANKPVAEGDLVRLPD